MLKHVKTSMPKAAYPKKKAGKPQKPKAPAKKKTAKRKSAPKKKAPASKALTPKQEAAAIKFVECGNKSEAYRFAYDCENMETESINVAASQLFANHNVSIRVEKIQAEHRERNKIDFDKISDMFMASYKVAVKEDMPAAMVSATSALGRLYGIISDRGTIVLEHLHRHEHGGEVTHNHTTVPNTRTFLEGAFKRLGTDKSLPPPSTN